MEEFELKDYVHILRRRKKYFIAFALPIFLVAIIFALCWSNYRAVATVEIAPPEVSTTAAAPSGMNAMDYSESLADSRISRLQQQVLSTNSLGDIITKLNLYSAAQKGIPMAAITDGMRKKIKIELVSSMLNSSASQKASSSDLSAIAFNLSFDYSNPVVAQQVTNELVLRFMDEDIKERRKAAHETSLFLNAQIKMLESTMAEQEKKIADFRAAHSSTQPEALAFNQQAAESALFNIQSIDAQITANEGTQGSLRAQLATTDPYSRVIADGQVLTTPRIQLKALKAQYTTLSAQYGPEHPDVVKLRHQIKALEKQVGGNTADTGEMEAQIKDLVTNLAASQKTYGANHPDVISLQRQLTTLEGKLAKTKRSSATENGIMRDADNPAYLQISAQLNSAQEQYKSLVTQKNLLMAQQEKYQSAIAANPAVMQKIAELSRDYDNSQLRYRELKEKKMAADMSETIEKGHSGQRLLLLNPPELPSHTQPGRMLFILGGFILAIIGGLGGVVVAEMISQSIVGPHHLESLLGVAPLVIIPHLFTENEASSLAHKPFKVLTRPLHDFMENWNG